MEVVPYLLFQGDCRDAFEFYAAATGAELTLATYGDSPAADRVGPEMRDRVIHAALAIGNARIMGSDAPPGHAKPFGGFNVALHVATAAEAERLFAALSAGGTVGVPLGPSFWSGCFGMVTDRFGVGWMVNGG